MNTQLHVLSFAVLLAILHPGYVTSQDVKVVRLCGRSLTDTMLIICDGRGFLGPLQLASSSSSHEDASLNRAQANSLLSRMQVFYHCCIHGCSRQDLESFCATPRDESVTPRRIAIFGDTTVAETSTTPIDQGNHIQVRGKKKRCSSRVKRMSLSSPSSQGVHGPVQSYRPIVCLVLLLFLS